ncbi:MBOAT family O-acyltransferase [Lichenicoccus sp.]|uniref:MBOAT family O-acyltransferase n=1 Tax=Lichenicoccus sp. TaxID=2781899 RepID=UPI003D09983E
MLFNSYGFIFAFLPVSVVGFYLAGLIRHRLAAAWLVLCSLFFYGWWNPHFLLLLVGSIACNYTMSRLIDRTRDRPRLQAALLASGVAGNLLLLFFYKYLLASLAFLGLLHALPAGWASRIILPLGISFFTFTQIGYLMDEKDGVVEQHGLLDYALFVTFFPHLIAGPILHNQEMIPQFADPRTYAFRAENLSVGLSIFAIGLAKKVIIADPLAVAANAGFATPHALSAYGAWQAVLSYALQLYFDFSGYSDMAIGVARMFGIVFPLNFNSPYKSRSIIDFWHRWHMTLTRYLTLYLYNPMALAVARWRMARGLGTSRQALRQPGAFAGMILLPMVFTMTLAGIWHGAGLQFLVFGLLHATYLTINHAWRIFVSPPRRAGDAEAPWSVVAVSVALTFLSVVVAQVFFRAGSTSGALSMLGGMLGLHAAKGAILFPAWLMGRTHGVLPWLVHLRLVALSDTANDLKQWLLVGIGFVMVWTLPNTQQIMVDYRPAQGPVRPFLWRRVRWHPGLGWGVALGALLIGSVCHLDDPSRFLYFQF